MKSLLFIALLFACSGAPRREAPHAVPIDAGASDAVIASEPDAVVDEPLACETYDEKNPACRGSPRACIEGHADCKCGDPPDVENPACWAVMPCPRIPDRRVRACRPRIPACTDAEAKNASTLHCQPPAFRARVLKAQMHNGVTLVTVAAGTNTVPKGWRGTLLRGDSDDALPGGALTILRASAELTVATVSLPLETVTANVLVRFEPP